MAIAAGAAIGGDLGKGVSTAGMGIAVLGGSIASVVPALKIMAVVTNEQVIPALVKMGAAAYGALGPIGLIAIAAVALGGALYYLYQRNQTAKEGFVDLEQALADLNIQLEASKYASDKASDEYKDLADQAKKAEDALKDVNDALKDYKSLTSDINQNKLDLKGAALDLKDAREELRKAKPQDREKAQYRVEVAEQRFKDLYARGEELAAKQAEDERIIKEVPAAYGAASPEGLAAVAQKAREDEAKAKKKADDAAAAAARDQYNVDVEKNVQYLMDRQKEGRPLSLTEYQSMMNIPEYAAAIGKMPTSFTPSLFQAQWLLMSPQGFSPEGMAQFQAGMETKNPLFKNVPQIQIDKVEINVKSTDEIPGALNATLSLQTQQRGY
jgi:hypothetical protein